MREFIDRLSGSVNDPHMDLEDFLPKTPGDPLAALVKQDLDPLSIDELNARIATLEAEIARARARIDRAVNHRANADGLFKR
jgi:uncharacterized small protein (DUF1192 family)